MSSPSLCDCLYCFLSLVEMSSAAAYPPPPKPLERIIPIKILGDGEANKPSIMSAQTPSPPPPPLPHGTDELSGGKRRHQPFLVESEDDDVDGDGGESGGSGRRSGCRNLLVTLDDGTTTETQGSVTRLTADGNEGDSATSNGATPRKKAAEVDDRLTIEEIGQETMRRETTKRRRRRSRSKSQEDEPEPAAADASQTVADDVHGEDGDDVTTKTVTTTTTTKTTRKTTTTPSPQVLRRSEELLRTKVAPSPSKSRLQRQASGGDETSDRVRFVPIQLPDGKVLRRDPDETVEIKTEFTNYCHQEFDDSRKEMDDIAVAFPRSSVNSSSSSSRSRHRSGVSPSAASTSNDESERVVPIKLATGEKFMPKFTRLEDLEPPEWSSFSPKKKAYAASGGGRGEPSKPSGGNKFQDGPLPPPPAPPPPSSPPPSLQPSGMKENVVPIRLVEETREQERHRTSTKEEKEEVNRERRLFNEDGEERTVFQEKSERREKEEQEEQNSSRRTTKTTTDKTTKSTQEKKVQHTVRFNVDESKHSAGPGSAGGGERSSSLESKSRRAKPVRERHRSGGAIPTAGSSDPNTEKALHEIDRDIHKIWRELQQLDNLRQPVPSSTGPLPPPVPPMRGATAPHRRTSPGPSMPPATPVKIRTYTTPKPQASPFVRSTPPPSPKLVADSSRVDRSSSSSTPPPPLSRVTPPPTWSRMTGSTSSPAWATPPRTLPPSTSPPPPPPLQARSISPSAADSHHPLPPSPWSRAGARTNNLYTPRRDMEPTRPGTIYPVRSTAAAAGSSSSSRPLSASSLPHTTTATTASASTSPYHHHRPATATGSSSAAGSSLKAISPSSTNSPFGASGTVLASVSQQQHQANGKALHQYRSANGEAAGNSAKSHEKVAVSDQSLLRRRSSKQDSPPIRGGLDDASSIIFADEDSKAVADGARSTLKEPRPLSRLIDQGTQTEPATAAGAAAENGDVIVGGEKGGRAEASKCAVQ